MTASIEVEDKGRKCGEQEFDPFKFHNLSCIERQLGNLEDEFPAQVGLASLGRTHEGRPIRVLTVVGDENDSSSREKKEKEYSLFMDCGFHAREWISPSFCLYFLEKILKGNKESKSLLSDLVIYMMPMVNPDGYAFSWTSSSQNKSSKHSHKGKSSSKADWDPVRMWRKNRRPIQDGEFRAMNGSVREALVVDREMKELCTGVDLNRNFELTGKSEMRSICQESYSGPKAFSEAESRALREGIFEAKNKTNLIGYISIHCCIQKIFSPYGLSWKKPHNRPELLRVMEAGNKAVKKVGGPHYEYEDVDYHDSDTIGTSLDWAYDRGDGAGIELSFLFEMAGDLNGTNRFLVREEKLEETLKQVFEGVKAMIEEIVKIAKGK